MAKKFKQVTRDDVVMTDTKTVGYGFVQRFHDGPLGSVMPNTIRGTRSFTGHSTDNDAKSANPGNPVLCRITVEQVFDSRGRVIAEHA